MTTSATAAYGTLLKMGDGAVSETFTTVAEIVDIDLPKLSAGMEDVTNHDSGGWEESIPTILSGGEPSFKLNWLPTHATQNETTGVLAALLNRTKKNWKIVLPGTVKTFAFSAYVTKFEGSAPTKGKLASTMTLKITGAVTVS